MVYNLTTLRSLVKEQFGEEVVQKLDQLYDNPFMWVHVGMQLMEGELGVDDLISNSPPSVPGNEVCGNEVYEEPIVEKEQPVGESLIKCKRCQSNTTFVQAQTRSGDEAMTVFITCTNMACGAKYRL